MAVSVAETFAQLRLILNKPFLQDSVGRAWQGTLGAGQDRSYDRVSQARLQRMPTKCTSDGLQYLASERELEQAIGEPQDSYREVVRQAWTVWAIVGSAQGDINALNRMNCLNVRIRRRKDFAGVAPYGIPYIDAFARDVWAQFDTILEQPMGWSLRYWGSGTWGTGVWGTTMTQAQLQQLRRLLRNFRSAHDTPMYVWMHFGGGSLWGLGAWDPARVWGGTGPVQRYVVGEIHWATRGLVPASVVGYDV